MACPGGFGRIGDWTHQRYLGRGAHGEVALWKNAVTSKLIAIKTFMPHSDSQNRDYHEKKFREEVEFMNRANNPHIVSTVEPPPEFVSGSVLSGLASYFYQPSPVLPSLYMEFCSRGTLRSLQRQPENINGLSERDVRAVLADVSDAISYLHSQEIIHRDIKPENILIQEDPSSGKNVYKLGDLGLAKDISAEGSLGKTIVGTKAYLAPDMQATYFEGTSKQKKGRKYGKSADYWSFGVIAFEICCGVLPFLPEEMDFQRYAAVKNKPDEVIAITKTVGGEYDFHSKFPYETRLPGLLQECIALWLPSMLRWDPEERGKYRTKQDPDALSRLNRILEARCVEVQSVNCRLHYSVNDSKTVGYIQEQIMIEERIPVNNQLLFTRDGVLLEPVDFAVDFLKARPLFLLDKSGNNRISTEIKVHSTLATFLQDPSTGTGKEFLIWKLAIYNVQAMMEESSRLIKYIEGLRKATLTSLQMTGMELSNKFYYLDKLLEQENRFREEHLEADVINKDPLESIVKARDALKRDMRQFPSNLDFGLTLQPTNISALKRLYMTMLEEYGKWKEAEAEGRGFNMSTLSELLSNIGLAQGSTLEMISANNKMLLEYLVRPVEDWNSRKHQSQLKELERLIHLLESRQILREKTL